MDDACVDVTGDPLHCGGCMPCTMIGGVCDAGACGCTAPHPDFCAGSNSCTDRLSDVQNCGTCGFRCTGDSRCDQGVCCGDGGVVCSGACCPGAACCSGNTCPTRHSNGLGGAFFDCNPVGTHSATSQKAAADAWKPGTDTAGFPCGNTLCLSRTTSDQCALFCDNGQVTASAVGSVVCLCADMGAAIVSTWN
jgi:hypothetical protein